MGDKYAEFYDRVGAEYGAARQGAKGITEKRVAAGEELSCLKAEAEELRSRLADFGAGKGDPMTAQEYQDASYREKWLIGAILAQGKILKGLQSEEAAANRALQSIHYRAIKDLDAMLKADAKAAEAAARARLDEAFGIVRPPEPVRQALKPRIMVPDRF